MWPDVRQLKQFYDSALGRVATRILRRRLSSCGWPSSKGLSLGVGFPLPFMDSPDKTVVLMPAGQGAIHGAFTLLGDEILLPFEDSLLDTALVTHTLEFTTHPETMLRELWRVLKPSGKLILLAANRRSLWPLTDSTPFGFGEPYSMRHLERLLNESLFTPLSIRTALFFPPSRSRLLLRTAGGWERLLRFLLPTVGGVIIAEAEKCLYAPILPPVRGRVVRTLMPAKPAG